MITLGIDFASQACFVLWKKGRAEVGGPRVGVTDEELLQLLRRANKVGMDVLFGWPTAFVESVTARAQRKPRSESPHVYIAIAAQLVVAGGERECLRFYRDLLGMEVIYGDENGYFSSLRTKARKDPILNLEHGNPATQWGRLIFHVSDVDGFWAYFKEEGLHPESPRDASWGERYFHMPDPDGHELSFACPI
jgi:catechol 2,3-dioxygenase-like lactoylglutathione lyase family enzyme